MMNDPIVVFIFSFLLTTCLYWGVWVPLSPRRNYAASLPGKTQDERIAELECSTNMCAHAVDDEHPVSMVDMIGREYWRLSDGRWWRKDEPCPYR